MLPNGSKGMKLNQSMKCIKNTNGILEFIIEKSVLMSNISHVTFEYKNQNY